MTRFEKMEGYPDEIQARFNSFIVTQFDDSLSVEMQIRSLIKWISSSRDLINDIVDYINLFIEMFDERLQEEIVERLNEWLDDGTLAQIINNDVFDMKADKIFVDSEIKRLEQKDVDLTIHVDSEIKRLEQKDVDLTIHVDSEIERLDQKDVDLTTHIDSEIEKYHSLRVKPLELIAHRGFGGLAPENTMIAFTNAHSKKAHSLECDVQITSDGVPVIIHDSTVNRTTNGTGRVDTYTLNTLRSLDAGSKLGGSLFKNTKIPTFEEFLIFSKGRTNKIYPEIKGIRNNSDIGTIVNLIKDYDMEEMTCIQSFTFEHLDEVRKYSKIINFGYLTENNLTGNQMQRLENDGNATILGKYTLFLNNTGLVNEAYARNIDVGTWTVDDLETINELLKLGIYKIMSNVSIGGF